MTYPTVSKISEDDVHGDLDKAFGLWTEVCNLQISRAPEGRADMSIMFVLKDHMDGFPFDGAKGTLAHAFLPDDGDCHFDDDEKYVSPGQKGIASTSCQRYCIILGRFSILDFWYLILV